MSGFFDRLAAQAHKSEGAILPRVPSRFEPVAESAGVEAPIETIAQTSAQPAHAKDRPAPQATPTVPRAETTNRVPSSKRNVSLKRDIEIPAAKAESSVEPVRAEAPATKEAQPKKRGREHMPEPAVILQRESLVENRSYTVRERIIEREHRASPIISPALQGPAAPAQRRDRVAERSSVLPGAPEVPTVVRVEAPVALVAHPVVPKPEPPPIAARVAQSRVERRMPQPHSPAPAETVVHVSIGRIEVLAVTQAEERRKREPARSPVMSLGDYLNARSRQAR